MNSFAQELQSKKKRILPTHFFRYFSYFAILCSILALTVIIIFVFAGGLPHLSWHFVFGEYSAFSPTLSGVLVTTVKTIFLSVLIATPIGVLSAVFLVEYTNRGNKIVKVIKVATETLSGVPSIIFGLIGMIVFVELLGLGYSVWSGALTLTLMILPTIITTVEESLRAVPDSYREGSFGLGATKLRTVFRMVLPNSVSGILSAIILSMGRIVSESACVMFTSGVSKYMPKTFSQGGATLAVAMYLFASEKLLGEAYATGCVLIILVVGLNVLSTLIAHAFKKDKTKRKTKKVRQK